MRKFEFGLLCALALGGAGAAMAQEVSPAPAAGSGYHLAATWKVGGDGGWDLLTVDPATRRLFVVRPDRVQVISEDKGKLLGEIPGLDGGHGVALLAALNKGYVTSGKAGTVIIFDLKTLKPIGQPIAVGKTPDVIIYEPFSKHLFVCNGASDDASVIDPATDTVVATVPLGGAPEFAVSDQKGRLYVNLEDKSQIAVVDMRENQVILNWPLAPGVEPTGIALDVVGRRLFSTCHNQKMIVLDSENGHLLAEVPIGQGVDGCFFDPAKGYAFASNGEGTLTMVQERADQPGQFAVVDSVPTRKGARTMAFDLKTSAIYLPTADFAPAPSPSPGEKPKRPKPVPGTFAVLELVR
jgi:YVTN family beta-propeller protein